MRPPLRKKIPKKRRASLEEPSEVVLIPEPVLNPALQAKIDYIRAKDQEFESISKIQQKSDELALTTQKLAKGIAMLTDDTDNVVDILTKWDVVFGVMADSDRHIASTADEWVRFVKPQDPLQPFPKKQRNA
ncbi:hypothetical protein INT47_012528 [Mucor saturninus]|uniref:DASH complex subunit DAD2 n=1 Tax=Mucor saturninus TaxID=64648 RepID=A0A8H7R139_9FUNG|nr:hypothetical protein INT47_012528 [Mucor saturninus]